MTITEDFERFRYFNFETRHLKKRKPFLKNWSAVFTFKVLRLETQYFLTELLSQMLMLRQIACRNNSFICESYRKNCRRAFCHLLIPCAILNMIKRKVNKKLTHGNSHQLAQGSQCPSMINLEQKNLRSYFSVSFPKHFKAIIL